MESNILILKGSERLNSICRSKKYAFFPWPECQWPRYPLAEMSVAEMSVAGAFLYGTCQRFFSHVGTEPKLPPGILLRKHAYVRIILQFFTAVKTGYTRFPYSRFAYSYFAYSNFAYSQMSPVSPTLKC